MKDVNNTNYIQGYKMHHSKTSPKYLILRKFSNLNSYYSYIFLDSNVVILILFTLKIEISKLTYFVRPNIFISRYF